MRCVGEKVKMIFLIVSEKKVHDKVNFRKMKNNLKDYHTYGVP